MVESKCLIYKNLTKDQPSACIAGQCFREVDFVISYSFVKYEAKDCKCLCVEQCSSMIREGSALSVLSLLLVLLICGMLGTTEYGIIER